MPDALQGTFSSGNYAEIHYKYSASDMSADKLMQSSNSLLFARIRQTIFITKKTEE